MHTNLLTHLPGLGTRALNMPVSLGQWNWFFLEDVSRSSKMFDIEKKDGERGN